MRDLKKDMARNNTRRTQDVMGDTLDIKRINTREMSRLFRSKKELF
jgi:hypothetical protein